MSFSFDERNLVPNAGLLPAAVLAQRIDLAGLVDERLRLAGTANGGEWALTVIRSILAAVTGSTTSLCCGHLRRSGSWLRAQT